MLKKETVILSSIAEFDEAFVPDCYKGKQLPEEVHRSARNHEANAAKHEISIEYVASFPAIQYERNAVLKQWTTQNNPLRNCVEYSTHI